MATYGFAVGSNLTDLGRNLVAQEQTRNALQAALAAAAAQQGVARTQAGASRYSTDSQSQGNQLTALMRMLENQRLTAATEREAGLRERELTLKDLISKLQFAGNTPEAMGAERVHEIELAKIAAEAQKAVNSRVDPRFASTLLEANLELDQIIKALPGIEAMANFESDALFNSRGKWFSGDTREKADYQTKAFSITSDPTKYGAFGKYLIPTIMPDGRVRFKANPPTLLPVPGAPNGPTPTLPPVVIDEVESALGGSTVPAVPVRPLNVPRGTNDVPTLPMLPTPDAEPGFFSKLAGLTDRSPIAQLAQLIGRSSVRTPDAPTTPVMPVSAAPPIVSLAETIRQQSPLVELVPIIDFDPGRTSRTSPNSAGEAESIVLGYIDNLAKEIQRLNQLPAQRGTESRKALVIKELSRLRQLMPSLN